MAITFRWKLSYQNEVEYEVFGHPLVTKLEVYSECRHGLLEYQFRDFNGGAEEFRRYMVARQGVKVEAVNDSWQGEASHYANRRMPQELYEAFVAHLRDSHAAYLVEHEAKRVKMGWTHEEYPPCEAREIPRPIYWSPEFHGYLTEPWFRSESPVLCSCGADLRAIRFRELQLHDSHGLAE
jgi:hypothetical protein